MFKLRLREPKISDTVNPEVKQLFLGRNTVFSLLAFIVGGVLVGNTLFHISTTALGDINTFVIGFTLFILGGVLSRTFRK
jgi:hypothetical protein